MFLLASASEPALWPTQPPAQWVPGGPFPGGKARPGRDANHSPPSSAEVENEQELYLLSPQAPSWRIAGQLYLLLLAVTMVYKDRLVWKAVRDPVICKLKDEEFS
jgi:hypothetical protein